MRYGLRIFPAICLLAIGIGIGFAAEDPTPAVREIVTAFEHEAEKLQLEADAELSRLRLAAVERLQAIQDRFCRDAKLDEALAVRELSRRVCGKPTTEFGLTPPPDAAEVFRAYEIQTDALERRTTEQVLEAGRRAAIPLQRLLDELCREARLDEAVQVRTVIQQLTGVIGDVRPDPGQLRAQPSDIGQVWYFDVVGKTSGSIYGTDVYTSDSTLAAAAVHTGVLGVNEHGVVKVTILPGIEKYLSSQRHGVMSHGYGAWSVSFKVERAYGIIRTKLAGKSATLPQPKTANYSVAAPATLYCCQSAPQEPPFPDVPRPEPPLPNR